MRSFAVVVIPCRIWAPLLDSASLRLVQSAVYSGICRFLVLHTVRPTSRRDLIGAYSRSLLVKFRGASNT